MFSDIFKRLLNFGARFSVYNVDMVTSKYCKFGYASMCGNISTTCVLYRGSTMLVTHRLRYQRSAIKHYVSV